MLWFVWLYLILLAIAYCFLWSYLYLILPMTPAIDLFDFIYSVSHWLLWNYLIQFWRDYIYHVSHYLLGFTFCVSYWFIWLYLIWIVSYKWLWFCFILLLAVHWFDYGPSASLFYLICCYNMFLFGFHLLCLLLIDLFLLHYVSYWFMWFCSVLSYAVDVICLCSALSAIDLLIVSISWKLCAS